jgi:hypothetical protein
MNMQQINQLISNSNFDNVITVINNLVFVNLDWLTNRDYQNQGVSELLYSVGQYRNHIFVFLIRDGVNVKLTGLEHVIKTVITNMNLNLDSCFIYSYQDLEIENSTFIEVDAIQMWCSNVAQIINLPIARPELCGKKFAALFGRHDMYRLKFFRHLYENYKNDSILSYNSTRAAWNYRFTTEFDDDKKWHDLNCPVLLDFEKSSGWVPFQNSLSNIHKHYHTYFAEIVCETDFYSNRFFTEKTLKNFHLGKPFLLFAGSGSLDYLKSRGFQTFGSYINEEYDTIDCPRSRYLAIIQEIDRLAKKSKFDLQTILYNLQPVFEHNKQRFRELAFDKKL